MPLLRNWRKKRVTKSNDKKVPALRFKGFTDDWEQRKLEDVAKIIGGGTPSTKIKEYWNGNINWYAPIEIGNQTFVSSSRKKISELGLKKSSAKLLPGGKTILFTSRAGIGDMAIMKTDGSTNQGFQSWVVRSNLADVYFLYSLGKKLKKQALRKASGSTFLEISNSEVKKLLLFIPSFSEQKDISKVFKLIDKLISLQQRKLEQLKLLKRMISLSIYPNFNDRIPIKFNLNSTWNKKKLKNITNYKNGTTHEQHQLLKGKFELINLNSISKEGRLKSSGKYINQQFPTLRKNDIVMILSDIAHGQLIGTSAVIPTNNKYILNQRVASLSPNENLNAVFISKYINLKQRYFKKMAAGMSQINLSKKDVEDFKLWVPNFKEQTKIANLLINFDLIEKNKN